MPKLGGHNCGFTRVELIRVFSVFFFFSIIVTSEIFREPVGEAKLLK